MLGKTKIAAPLKKNSTKSKQLGLLMVAAMVLSSSMLAYADNDEGKKDSWHNGKKDQMFSKVLNLTADQEKQLKDNHQKEKDAMKSFFEQMKTNRDAFDAAIIKASPDMNKINDVQTQIKALQSKMVDDRLNSILEVKKVLTPEQFAGYMALKKEKEMRMHDGRHQFGHKDGFGKDKEGHHHWGDKDEGDQDSDD